MSNATQNSRNSGDSRRRRSRGGNNNRNQNQNDRRGGERENRGERDDRENRNSGRSEEFRPQSPRPPRGRPPVQLSWWQKLLKAIGLYKEPTPPARPERKPQSEPRPAKSNTRNARTQEGTDPESRDERPPRRENREARGGESRGGEGRESRGGESRENRGGEGRENRGGERNRGEQRSRGGDRSTVESPRVYVGNLSYDVSEQDLQELFKGVGPVRNVEIVYNRTTHRSKGYGFVEMLHMDEAIRAVEVLNDQHFMGRKMTVSGAKSKGQDDRDEHEERPEREARPVVLASIPVAAAQEEPTIQTIVENVTAEEPMNEPILSEASAEFAATEIEAITEVEAAPVESEVVTEIEAGTKSEVA